MPAEEDEGKIRRKKQQTYKKIQQNTKKKQNKHMNIDQQVSANQVYDPSSGWVRVMHKTTCYLWSVVGFVGRERESGEKRDTREGDVTTTTKHTMGTCMTNDLCLDVLCVWPLSEIEVTSLVRHSILHQSNRRTRER